MARKYEGITTKDIRSGLAELRQEGLLFDIELEAQGQRISAHRNVLASVSPYFRVLFAGSFREANESVVELQGIQFESLKTIIKCFYEPGLTLTIKNIEGIYSAAHFFQMDKIVLQCQQFVEDNLSKDTCLSFLRLAQTYGFKKIIAQAHDCILEHLVQLRDTPDFMNMSKDALNYYLSNNKLNTGRDESLVFYTVKDWIGYDPTERMQYAAEMLTNVRFNAIKQSDLTEISTNPIVADTNAQTLVDDALAYHAKQFEKPLVDDVLNKPRGREGLFVVQTLDLDVDGGSEIYFTSLKPTIVRETFSPPAIFTNGSLSAVQMNNFLFIFGVDNDSFQQISYRFDATMCEWLKLAPVPQPATINSCAVGLGQNIFFMGGLYVEKKSIRQRFSPKAFAYDIAANYWRKMEKDTDKAPMFSRGAATSSKENSRIYVSGGRSAENLLSSRFLAFDLEANKWLVQPHMGEARAGHVMEKVGQYIFVVGGETNRRWYPPGIERFNIAEQHWTTILIDTGGAIKSWNSFSLVKDDKIVLVGGAPEETACKIRLFDTKCLDIGTNKVRLQLAAENHVCGLLTMKVK